MVNYVGLFFEGEDLDKILLSDKRKLDRINDVIHCTFEYKPKEFSKYNDIIGKEFVITLVGYANDNINSGFVVLLDDEVKKYYRNVDPETGFVIPHITSTLSNDADASDTSNLNFELLDMPVIVKGKFGYYIKDDNGKAYVSYEKYSV